MNQAEIIAYKKGVEAVLTPARATSAALEPRLTRMPTRINFAIGALEGLAEEGRALFLLPALDVSSPASSAEAINSQNIRATSPAPSTA